MLTVLSGKGVVTDESEEHAVEAGQVICYAPNELHGMRAIDEELQLLAAIAPRPGTRPVSLELGPRS